MRRVAAPKGQREYSIDGELPNVPPAPSGQVFTDDPFHGFALPAEPGVAAPVVTFQSPSQGRKTHALMRTCGAWLTGMETWADSYLALTVNRRLVEGKHASGTRHWRWSVLR